MNDLNSRGYEFQKKAAALLNNKTFSDVEIQVNDGSIRSSFPAHKLFLSMNSQEFAKIFYGNGPSPKVLKIFDFKSKIVYMMLEFLYTNKVNFSATKEARELYTLSKKYGIRNLQELCVDHISRKEINEDNVLFMYESAYREKYLKCLDFCRQIVSSDTKAVINSPSFAETSLDVIEDILKQDTLTVDSELDIIYAVIKWTHRECKRRNLTDPRHLRDCISPLLYHIRFLNLKYEEFSDVVEKYPIFTAYESSLITRKLMQPDESVNLPPHICQSRIPRMYSTTCHNAIITAGLDVVSLKPSSSGADPQSNNAAKLSLLENSKLKQCPVSKVAPQIKVSIRQTFDFSLLEAEKHLSTAFKNDIKCSVSIDLLKGMIIIHLIELRISPSLKSGEHVKVFLSTSNTKMNFSVSDTFNEELKKGILTLSFNQPMKILEGNHAEIEITIEDLKLNRCCILKERACQLKYCSDIVASVVCTSNQMNDLGEPFFLIKRLIYSLN